MCRHAKLIGTFLATFVLATSGGVLPAAHAALVQQPIPVTFGPNINLSSGNELGQDQRETAVAVSPNDPLNIVAANIDKPFVTFSFSAASGLTWSFGGALPRD